MKTRIIISIFYFFASISVFAQEPAVPYYEAQKAALCYAEQIWGGGSESRPRHYFC
ncbi:hypothetical protein JW935_17540 [candidate division KSB1 bacterium]|nr:hypothetical protein [candidate division KSB1 bacterium]